MSDSQPDAAGTKRSATTAPKKKLTFFSLPTELRLVIYSEYFAALPIKKQAVRKRWLREPPLLRAHDVIKDEALKTYYDRLCTIRYELADESDALRDQDSDQINRYLHLLQMGPGIAQDAAVKSFSAEGASLRRRLQTLSHQIEQVVRQMERVEEELMEIEESEESEMYESSDEDN